MFCKHCGNEMPNEAIVCVKCGVGAGSGNNFCPNCGQGTDPLAMVCTNCGVTLSAPSKTSGKSKMVAGLLGIFLGGYGIHNFYLGFTKKAILQIVLTFVTCGFASLWGLIEGILYICGSNGFTTDANGDTLV